MEILDFNPTVYRIQFESTHGLTTWDLLTVEGETPRDAVYFMKKGDAPSSSDSDRIIEAIDREDWTEIELSVKSFNPKLWDIDTTIFETAGSAYSRIRKALKDA